MRALSLGLILAAAASAATNAPQVTFNKDVLPILQNNCQGCHRAGETAPMSLLTYKQARPWAAAIKEAVLSKKMPPWFADPHFGKFSNDRSMSQAEIDTLVAWADSGAKEGSGNPAIKPKEFVEGWNIGTPDWVVEMPVAVDIPASGTLDYQYFVVPTGFTEDKYVQYAEPRPGNRKLVHHIIAFIREPGNPWMKDAKPGVAFVPKRDGKKDGGDGGSFQGEFLAGYAPGSLPVRLKPGEAKLVKAGSDIVLQMHFTANGTAGTDQSKVGFVFAKEKPTQRVVTLAAGAQDFAIPPGDPNYKVEGSIKFREDTTLIALLPHMHLRGKDFEYRIKYPDGKTETLLSVPHYSFSWQLTYDLEKPIHLPKGTEIEAVAHFDNSANNPNNPDPTKTVRFGEQSWDEMMLGFFEVAIPIDMEPMELFRPKQPKQAALLPAKPQ